MALLLPKENKSQFLGHHNCYSKKRWIPTAKHNYSRDQTVRLLGRRWDVNDAVLFADTKVNGPYIYVRFLDVKTTI